MDRQSETRPRRVAFSKPKRARKPPHDKAICASGRRMDRRYWPAGKRVRHALHAPHQSIADLPQDWEPARCSASARPYKDGLHRPIPWDRRRRRFGDRRKRRHLSHFGFPAQIGGSGRLPPLLRRALRPSNAVSALSAVPFSMLVHVECRPWRSFLLSLLTRSLRPSVVSDPCPPPRSTPRSVAAGAASRNGCAVFRSASALPPHRAWAMGTPGSGAQPRPPRRLGSRRRGGGHGLA